MKSFGLVAVIVSGLLGWMAPSARAAEGCGKCMQATSTPEKAPAKEAGMTCPMSGSIDKAIALLDQAKDATDLAKVRDLLAQARKELADGKAQMSKCMAADKAVWTCPMHPEVKQGAPGKCPKCGMALKEVKPSAPAQNDPQSAHH